MSPDIKPGTLFRFRPATPVAALADPPTGAICVATGILSTGASTPLWRCLTFDDPANQYAAYEHEMEVIDEV